MAENLSFQQIEIYMKKHCCYRSVRVNPYRAGTELTRFNKVNIMAADALAPYVAWTSAALILIM